MPRDPRFAGWVERWSAPVYRSAFRIAGNAHDALDVTQQVFAAALRNPERVARHPEPERYLRWLALKTALMGRRSAKNRSAREEAAMAISDAGGIDAPDRAAETAEARRAIRSEVAALPDELRTAVVLRFHEGLTFDAIAELLAIADTTAHERVTKALSRLRARLTQLGLGAAALALEGELHAAGAEAIEVPASLAPTLLATTAAKSASVAFLSLAAPAVFLAGTVAVFASWSDDPPAGRPAATAPAAIRLVAPGPPDPLDAPPAREPAGADAVASGDERVAPTATGVLRGRVDAPADREILGSLRVVALDRRRASKGFLPRFEATPAQDGTYRIELPVAADGSYFGVSVEYADATVAWGRDVQVKANEEAVADLALEKPVGERPGHFDLEVRIADDAGVPQRNVHVVLFRRIPYVGDEPFGVAEANATTDANGLARLAGEQLGGKRLAIQGSQPGFETAFRDFSIERAGSSEQRITVLSPREIRGRVERDDHAPLVAPHVSARSLSDPARVVEAEIAADGGFRIAGLEPGLYVIEASADDCQAATADMIASGSESVGVTLKSAAILSIAGVRFDAATNSPALEPDFDVDLYAIDPATTPEALVADVLPNRIQQVPRQKLVSRIPGAAPPPTDRFDERVYAPGTFVAVSWMIGRAPATAGPIRVDAAHPRVEGVELRFEKPAAVEGRVLDAAGAPLEGAFVFTTGTGPLSNAMLQSADDEVLKGGGQAYVWFAQAKTGAGGRFKIEGLPAQLPIRLAIAHPRFAPRTGDVLSLRAGATTGDVELRFDRAR